MSLRNCTSVNPIVGTANLCLNEVAYASYGYNVTQWTAIVFTSLFAISFVAHLIQAIRSKMLFLYLTVTLCALDETIGWSMRLWSAYGFKWEPSLGGYWNSPPDAFLGQIASLIIGPAFLSAAWYIILGKIVTALGPQYCRIRPKVYTITFVCGDVLCLLVQAAGGGLAASASKPETQDMGSNVMVAGVILQMIVMALYSILLVDFVIHYVNDRPVRNRRTAYQAKDVKAILLQEEVKKARILLVAMVVSTILIFIRSVYRTIELLDGWTGPIITNETLFIVLDGIAVFLATAIFNVIHPKKYLPTVSSSMTRIGSHDADGLPKYGNGSQQYLNEQNYSNNGWREGYDSPVELADVKHQRV